MLAQTPVDPVGTGVFIQILAQLGAVGLLAIIVWQVPKLIKELREWRQSSDIAHQTERGELKMERDALLKAYREEAHYEREVCSKNFDKLADIATQYQQTTHQALDKLGDAVNRVGLTVDRVGEAVEQHDSLARQAMDQISQTASQAMDKVNPVPPSPSSPPPPSFGSSRK